MSRSEPRIEHVSDTNLITAFGRALETARADAIIHDPLAGKLAGERGAALARTVYSPEWLGIIVALRSHVIDEILMEAIATFGIEVVITLGAGLDTRPWRLDLPPDLRWLEVDFPPVLEYKSELIANEKPRCHVERFAADLTRADERHAVFTGAGNQRGLIITEGLLLYLPRSATEALATEPIHMSGTRYWLLDIAASALGHNMHRGEFEDVEKVRAKDRVEGQEILNLVRHHGWNLMAHRSYTKDALAIGASRGLEVMTAPSSSPDTDSSGIYLFAHA